MYAMRHNEGKADLTYLLDMLDALSHIYSKETIVDLRSIKRFVNGGSFEGLAELAYGVDDTELARVFMFGAEKYARGDWLKGRPYMDTIKSAMRHYIAHTNLEERDEESGCLHITHFHWNILAILQYHEMGMDEELDDRPKIIIKEEPEFKEGDYVRILKPDDTTEFPQWVCGTMDDLNNTIDIVQHVSKDVIFVRNSVYAVSPRWLTLVDYEGHF